MQCACFDATQQWSTYRGKYRLAPRTQNTYKYLCGIFIQFGQTVIDENSIVCYISRNDIDDDRQGGRGLLSLAQDHGAKLSNRITMTRFFTTNMCQMMKPNLLQQQGIGVHNFP